MQQHSRGPETYLVRQGEDILSRDQKNMRTLITDPLILGTSEVVIAADDRVEIDSEYLIAQNRYRKVGEVGASLLPASFLIENARDRPDIGLRFNFYRSCLNGDS